VDSALITAISALITVMGGGAGFIIRRADKRRESNEALLIDNLRAQVAKAEKEARRWKRAWALADNDAAAYREQLIQHDIPPLPPHRTPLPEDDE
jgi:hypothetical protein